MSNGVKFKFINKNNISWLPKSPGVYALKKGAKLLYIGKATNLQERVKNHFLQPRSMWEQTLLRPASAKATAGKQGYGGRVGFIKTNSEIEALILEAILIKRYQPKYNVVWRDDKNYFFVAITKEDFPKIFITHQPPHHNEDNPHAKFWCGGKLTKSVLVWCGGPFVDGKTLKQTLKILRKVFPYRNCNKMPKKPCLWYQLKRCPAPCLVRPDLSKELPNFKNEIKKECQENVKNIIKILKGKKNQVLRDLKKEMKIASKLKIFEKAAKIRDQIKALEKVISHARIFEPGLETFKKWEETEIRLKKILKTRGKISRIEAYDVSNIQGKQATGSMTTFINGHPDKNYYRKFKIEISGKPDDIAMLKEILKRRFKHKEWPYPDLILIDGGIGQLNAAKLTIKQFSNLAIKVLALAKGKNELFIERKKESILLKNLPREIFNLILQLRDEAHRFAIAYHRKLREFDFKKTF
jgi:excinuclease ABC subunit C